MPGAPDCVALLFQPNQALLYPAPLGDLFMLQGFFSHQIFSGKGISLFLGKIPCLASSAMTISSNPGRAERADELRPVPLLVLSGIIPKRVISRGPLSIKVS